MKNFNKSRKLGLWGAMLSGLLVLSAVAANSISTPEKKADRYDCYSSCYINYRACLMGGQSQTYCQSIYQQCTIGCSGGGTNGAAPESN